MKGPLTPAGIEPATFRFVAQHLNHCATAVPSTHSAEKKFQKHFRNVVSFRVFQDHKPDVDVQWTARLLGVMRICEPKGVISSACKYDEQDTIRCRLNSDLAVASLSVRVKA